MMETKVYLIKPFTNMHVGSGKTNAGIVDNTIQRDVLTNLPIINSTSLKGALREYAVNHFSDKVDFVFGKGNDKKGGIEIEVVNQVNTPGRYNFFTANLLSIPARSNKLPFLNATTKSIISGLVQQISLMETADCKIIDDETRNALEKISNVTFEENERAICFDDEITDSVVEFYNIKTVKKDIPPAYLTVLKKWIGKYPVIVEDTTFKSEISDKLPIIARNYLEDGQSSNLWYEEILPRESVLYTLIANTEPQNTLSIDFDGIKLQIGANASVGYGYSSIYQLK